MKEEMRKQILSLMQEYQVEAQERFSQNFLIDEEARDKIISSLPIKESAEVVEIGPGLGSLTSALVEKAEHVTAIDFDRDMIKVLQSELKKDNLSLIQGDFLKQDLNMFHVKHTIYVGNLPYAISRDLIKKVICDPDFIYFGFMVQQELADKLFFLEGSPLNNPYSVMLALRGKLSLTLTLHPGSFYPPPRVSSSFLGLKTTDSSYVSNASFDFVSKLFKNPRKNLSNNLKGSEYESLLPKLESLKIAQTKRPHQLTLNEIKLLIETAGLKA
ncbi:MAG: 16S rRNA (adenine(1518)-N(6)/adenine(1519)-N(6))-dimethyltransferase RsmA [Bacilli bacterium]|jgi:16S rRNA (adenine1518-N6/adenine1519-N6)-dimethyltransferase|nr:16S rRNA (adenine(1518)-N(6)/adenine(1519)-N(6))-dimethyltransferase RsmA [Bacilli bacterium]